MTAIDLITPDALNIPRLTEDELQRINDGLKKSAESREYRDIVRTTISRELNQQDKIYLNTIYTNVGWRRVEVINSSENGERPGIAMITLYK